MPEESARIYSKTGDDQNEKNVEICCEIVIKR